MSQLIIKRAEKYAAGKRAPTFSKIFRWQPDQPGGPMPVRVEVAGTFNGWQPVALKRDRISGVWQLTLHDIPGHRTHNYMLLVNGNNVYPREIEEIIYQYPGVKEAAVIGIPDPRKGEQPLAYVAAADGVTLDEKALLQFIREKLADYKVPKRIIFMPALPRNATGKILKTELRLAQTRTKE